MTALTTNERKAAERQRRRDQGLKPLEVWAKPEHHAEVKAFAVKLAMQPQKLNKK